MFESMIERMKWLAIMVAIAGVIMGAQTVVGHYFDQPVLAVEPTHTSTLAPSATAAPTKTIAPVKAKAAASGVRIIEIAPVPTGNNSADEQVVVIENRLDQPVDLAGWTLRDDQKNVYTFPSYHLNPGQMVNVWTRVGVDRADNLFWNLADKVWNVGGDCGYLRNADGDLQDHFCY